MAPLRRRLYIAFAVAPIRCTMDCRQNGGGSSSPAGRGRDGNRRRRNHFRDSRLVPDCELVRHRCVGAVLFSGCLAARHLQATVRLGARSIGGALTGVGLHRVGTVAGFPDRWCGSARWASVRVGGDDHPVTSSVIFSRDSLFQDGALAASSASIVARAAVPVMRSVRCRLHRQVGSRD